jgi:hypothetical protein
VDSLKVLDPERPIREADVGDPILLCCTTATPGGGDSWRSPVAIAADAMNSRNSGTRWSFMLPNA